MKNEENKAFRTAFWLLGPLIFYELCTEASAWVCSLFGTQDALLVTGGGALLALPFLYAAYRKKLQVDVRERDAGAGQVPRTDRRWCTATVRQIFANGMFFCSPGWHGCLPGPECAPAASFPVV